MAAAPSVWGGKGWGSINLLFFFWVEIWYFYGPSRGAISAKGLTPPLGVCLLPIPKQVDLLKENLPP